MKRPPATPIARHWHEDRQTEPRFYKGVDHGSAGIVLAERRDGNALTARLIWISGHKHAACGVRGFGHVYAPASLTLVDTGGYWIASLFDGGRVSKSRLAEHASIIDRVMGEGTTALIDTARTLIIIGKANDNTLAVNVPPVLKQTA